MNGAPGVKVFIAGSRALSRLTPAIRERIDRVVEADHDVLVGDANGADRAVQQYLADLGYRRVTVFCTGLRCRHNVGGWDTRTVPPPADVRNGFNFYAVKDRAMAAEATHGLMLWDGGSRGTLANIRTLVSEGKPVVVYLTPANAFVTVKSKEDVTVLLGQPSAGSAI